MEPLILKGFLQWIFSKLPILRHKENVGIAIISPGCKNGGTGRVAHLLATELSKRKGYDVYLLSGPLKDGAYEIGESVKREVTYKEGKFLEEKVRELVRTKKIDIFVHNKWRVNEARFLKGLGQKVISICHTTLTYPLHCNAGAAMRNFFNRISVRKLSDVVCCLTQMDVEILMRHGINGAVCLPNPLTFDDRRVRISSLTSKNIVFVGRADRCKRVELCIQAMRKVVTCVPDAKLQIVGEFQNAYSNELKTLVNELNLEENVEFCGYCSDVKEFYQNASVFVLSSSVEAFSMVLVEAKAHGLPNIVTGMNYLESAKEGTIHVGPDGVDGMAREIVKLLTDKKYRIRNGRSARKSLRSIRTENTINMWEKLIHATLCGNDAIQQFIEQHQRHNSNIAMLEAWEDFDLAVKRNPALAGVKFEDLFDQQAFEQRQRSELGKQ